MVYVYKDTDNLNILRYFSIIGAYVTEGRFICYNKRTIPLLYFISDDGQKLSQKEP
jgi:hypothetical protein